MVPFVHSLSYRLVRVHMVGTPWNCLKDSWGSPDPTLRTNDIETDGGRRTLPVSLLSYSANKTETRVLTDAHAGRFLVRPPKCGMARPTPSAKRCDVTSFFQNWPEKSSITQGSSTGDPGPLGCPGCYVKCLSDRITFFTLTA